jgi:hypothetical protein
MTVRINVADEREAPFELSEGGLRPDVYNGRLAAMNADHWRWASAAVSGYFSAHIALSAALMADAVPYMRPHALPALSLVLGKVGLDQLTWAIDPDGKQIMPEREHWTESLTSKGIAAWLLAYWICRRNKLLAKA